MQVNTFRYSYWKIILICNHLYTYIYKCIYYKGSLLALGASRHNYRWNIQGHVLAKQTAYHIFAQTFIWELPSICCYTVAIYPTVPSIAEMDTAAILLMNCCNVAVALLQRCCCTAITLLLHICYVSYKFSIYMFIYITNLYICKSTVTVFIKFH